MGTASCGHRLPARGCCPRRPPTCHRAAPAGGSAQVQGTTCSGEVPGEKFWGFLLQEPVGRKPGVRGLGYTLVTPG